MADHRHVATRRVVDGWVAECSCGRVLKAPDEETAAADWVEHRDGAAVAAAANRVWGARG